MALAWIFLFGLTLFSYNNVTGSAVRETQALPENILFGIFVLLLGVIVTTGYLLYREHKIIQQ